MDQLILLSVGLGLTLFVFSYLVNDNPMYRIAVNLLAGMSLTYALLVVVTNVLIPRVVSPLLQSSQSYNLGLALSVVPPLALGAFILFKLSKGWAPAGNWGMAVLIGVGAGLAMGGALIGSLIGLAGSAAAIRGAVWVFSLIALLGTVTTLAYFWYTSAPNPACDDRRPPVVRFTAGVGRIFMMVTFGALFGGALVAGIASLVDRLGLVAQIIQAVSR